MNTIISYAFGYSAIHVSNRISVLSIDIFHVDVKSLGLRAVPALCSPIFVIDVPAFHRETYHSDSLFLKFGFVSVQTFSKYSQMTIKRPHLGSR